MVSRASRRPGRRRDTRHYCANQTKASRGPCILRRPAAVNAKQRCLPSGSDTSIWPGGWSLCLPLGDLAADLVHVQVTAAGRTGRAGPSQGFTVALHSSLSVCQPIAKPGRLVTDRVRPRGPYPLDDGASITGYARRGCASMTSRLDTCRDAHAPQADRGRDAHACITPSVFCHVATAYPASTGARRRGQARMSRIARQDHCRRLEPEAESVSGTAGRPTRRRLRPLP